MTFKDALHILSTNLIEKIILPDWAKYLTKQTRKVDLAFKELKVGLPTHPNRVCVIRASYPRAAIYDGNGKDSQEWG